MSRTRKMQLKAMNKALEDFTEKAVVGLSLSDANTIKQSVVYNEPYNNIEVYKSNQLYKTMVDVSNSITQNITTKKEEVEKQ